jgi:nicotinic acid mononucleotide adenylyltransferase
MIDSSLTSLHILANPPTGKHGHLGIVQYLIDLEEFEEIWILPVYVHQFSSKQLIDYRDRLEMCRLSLEKLNCGVSKTRVRVLPLEKEVNERCAGRHGTIDTVTHILNNYNVTLHLVIGEDAYRDICLYRWKHGDRCGKTSLR